MGCWNGTCMVSNLPILSGDKVKLVFLLPRYQPISVYGKTNVNYVTDIYSPCLFPISGEYDDYGKIENISHDWNTDIVMTILRDFFGEKIIVDGKEINEYSIDNIIYGIERGSINYFKLNSTESLINSLSVYDKNFKIVPDGEKRKSILSYVLVREDIWNHIIENHKGEEINYKREDNDSLYISTREFYTDYFNDYMNDTEIFREKNIFRNENSTVKIIGSVFYEKHLKSLSDNSDFLKQWLELMIVNSFLNNIRKPWMIQAGAGSQNAEWIDYKLLSEKIIEISTKEINNYE